MGQYLICISWCPGALGYEATKKGQGSQHKANQDASDHLIPESGISRSKCFTNTKQSYWRIAVLVVFVPLRGQSHEKTSLLTFNTFPYFHYQNLWQWPHTTNTLESLWSTRINQPHKDRLMLNQLAACQNDTLTTCITCGGPRCDPFTTLNTSPPNLPIQWSSSERRWGRYPSRHTFTPKEQKDMMDRKTPQRCCQIVEGLPYGSNS